MTTLAATMEQMEAKQAALLKARQDRLWDEFPGGFGQGHVEGHEGGVCLVLDSPPKGSQTDQASAGTPGGEGGPEAGAPGGEGASEAGAPGGEGGPKDIFF